MPETPGEQRQAALRRKLAIDIRRMVASAKADIALGTVQGDADAQATLDDIVARTRTIAR